MSLCVYLLQLLNVIVSSGWFSWSLGRRCSKWETTSERMRCCETSPGLPRVADSASPIWQSRQRTERKATARYIKWFQEYYLMYEHGTCKYDYNISNTVSEYQIHMHYRYKTSSERVCIYIYSSVQWPASPQNMCKTPCNISSKMKWIKFTTAFYLIMFCVFNVWVSTINYLPFSKIAYGL